MNLVEMLESRPSKAANDPIVRFVGADRSRFAQLVRAFFKGPYRVTQHAAGPLNYCVEKHPGLVKPHLRRLVRNLKKPGLPDAVKRNTVRLLQFIRIPRALQGDVINLCFTFLADRSEPVAVRVFSMTVLANLCREEPELGNELRIIIEDALPYGSAGFRSRASRVLQTLNQEPCAASQYPRAKSS